MTDGADQSQAQNTPGGQSGAEKAGTPPPAGPFFQRTDWLSFGLTTLVALAVYLSTLAPEVTLEFSGLLSTSAMYAGVAHPPGYPVWTLYSWLFVKLLPCSNIAWRVAVGSAMAAALACGLVALMVSRAGTLLLETTPAFAGRKTKEQKLLRLVCGYAAGMALGLSRTVWRVAVVAEIWAVSIFLFTLMLCLLMRWTGIPERRRYLYGAVYVFGMLLTSNQELFVMAPGLLLVVLLSDQALGRDLSLIVSFLALAAWALGALGVAQWPVSDMLRSAGLLGAFVLSGAVAVIAIARTRRLGGEWRATCLCSALLLLGLGWYCYLPFASTTNPPVNWAYPRTAEGFFHGITRGQYERYLPTDELGRFIGQLWIVARSTSHEFGWPYFLFAALPFALLRRMTGSARNWLLGSATVFVCVGPLLIALLNPSADAAHVRLLAPYFAPMNVVLALWTGLGLLVFGSWVAKPRGHPRPSTSPAC